MKLLNKCEKDLKFPISKKKKILVKKKEDFLFRENLAKEEIKKELAKIKKIEVKKKVKKPKKDSIDDVIKTKKKIKTFSSYYGGFGTIARVEYVDRNIYSSVDYGKLFSYLGSGVKTQFKENYEVRNPASDDLGEKDILSYEQVNNILRRTVMSKMIKTSIDNINIDEKEKFNKYYKELHWNIVCMKYEMLGLGNHA